VLPPSTSVLRGRLPQNPARDCELSAKMHRLRPRESLSCCLPGLCR
jgi:hypothetical protein